MEPCCWFCSSDFNPPALVRDRETGLDVHEECVEFYAEVGDPTAVGIHRRLFDREQESDYYRFRNEFESNPEAVTSYLNRRT